MSNTQARILLVEDNRVQARATQNCLGKKHEVVLETSVEDAHARFDPAEFDLVVVDWGLPGESGLSFVRRLRDHPEAQGLPIMMQTGEDRAEHVQKAVAAGVDDYVVKPVYCETLREKADALLASSPAGPEDA
jgi:two-component system phosphate regulon response regulator PhoB